MAVPKKKVSKRVSKRKRSIYFSFLRKNKISIFSKKEKQNFIENNIFLKEK